MDSITWLKERTGKQEVQFTDRCNKAIAFAYKQVLSLHPAKKKMLVQDEGGWLTYRPLAEALGLECVSVATHDGVIDLPDLASKVSQDVLLFMFNRFSGYHVRNPVEEINRICHESSVLTVEDQCGELGSSSSDYIVGSFGRWKPIPLGHGGFLACDVPVAATCSFPALGEEVYPLLLQYDERVKFLRERCALIKQELSAFEILHTDSESLVVVVCFKTEEEKEKILAYCTLHQLPYEICPRMIRSLRNAVSIKRLCI